MAKDAWEHRRDKLPRRQKGPAVIEFGDFQTPRPLAWQVCQRLLSLGVSPRTLIEPTCGTGSFLLAAADTFSSAQSIRGADIDRCHLRRVRTELSRRPDLHRFQLHCGNFLDERFCERVLDPALPEPWLILGNPPWVTNTDVSAMQGTNLPAKWNVDRAPGLAAITGRANFDISEWILRRCAEALAHRTGALAMLCKTTVARRFLTFAFQRRLSLRRATVHAIDAPQVFGVAVDACLLVSEFAADVHTRDVEVFDDLSAARPATRWGWRDGALVADARRWEHSRHWLGQTARPADGWRSGVKHDCAAVLELRRVNREFRNGFGETVDVEPDCVFPLLKSSDLAGRAAGPPRRWLLLPQRELGDDTAQLADRFPKTWRYLVAHAQQLDRRRSRIYRQRPRFAVFGVGSYAFSPWKIAIAGFGKQLCFTVVGSFEGQPCLLDDTCYFLPCRSRAEAEHAAAVLHSPPVQDFFHARVFWDAKRPIQAEVLNQLDRTRLYAGGGGSG